jgi:hypothetical protein
MRTNNGKLRLAKSRDEQNAQRIGLTRVHAIRNVATRAGLLARVTARIDSARGASAEECTRGRVPRQQFNAEPRANMSVL